MALTKAHNRMVDGAFISVIDYGAVGDNSTDNTDAIKAAVAVAAAAGKVLYFPAGTYLCSGLIGLVACSMLGESFLSTIINYTGVGDTFIRFGGKTIENLAFNASNAAHASYFTRTTASFQSFNNCRWDGPNPPVAGGALLYMNTALIIEINGCFFSGHNISLIGQDGGGTGYCNGVTISNTLLGGYTSAAIQNPGQGWNLENVLFEHTPSTAPIPNGVLAINCDTAVNAYGLNLSGCWFGDNTTTVAHSYIRFKGYGLSITGSYINGSGANNCTVVEVTGPSEGITLSGNYISNFANIVKTNDLATRVSVFGNTVRLTANEIFGTFTNVLPVTGLKFPATVSASSDPNTLDDYEEGTFDPNPFFGDSQIGLFTLTKNIGRYTKVGNVVQVSIFVRWTDKPTSGQSFSPKSVTLFKCLFL